MPQITDIKPQKRQKRFNIYVDGKFAFALSAEALVKAGLKVNQEISPQQIEKLIQENEFQKVYDRVLKFLSFRPRSEKEIHYWFVRKNVGETTQELVSVKLKKLGYLNDEEFARWWVEQRSTFKPAGTRLLILELRQKGISESIVSRVTCHVSQSDERELAKKVAEKKLKSFKSLSGLELKQKLGAALARRGFSWEIIKEVVDPAKPG